MPSYLSTVFASDSSLSGSYPLVGITSAICGNLIISIALNVQRYAHLRLKDTEDRDFNGDNTPSNNKNSVDASPENYLKSRWWWLGVLLMTVGETGNFVAYGFAPASIVSPLGVLALVSNCVVAPIFFNEQITRRNLTGVGITVAGILLIILSVQPPSNSKLPLTILRTSVSDDTLSKLPPHEFIIYAVSQLSFRIYLLVVISLIAILFFQTTYVHRQPTHIYNLFFNLGLVALFGAFTALSTKGLSSILNYSFSKAIADPITYTLLLVLILTAVVQVIYLNRALKLFDATMVLPVHFVFFTISVIVGSAITFHDFENSDPGHIFIFFLGCILTFIGVWLITSSSSSFSVLLSETQPLLPESSVLNSPNTYSTISPSSLETNNYQNLLALPQSSRPLPKKSHSYTNGYSILKPVEANKVICSSSSMHHANDSSSSAISFFLPHSTDQPAVLTSSSVVSAPSFCYFPAHTSSGATTPDPAALTSSGFFIGTVLQTKRSLGVLRLYQHQQHQPQHLPTSYQPISTSLAIPHANLLLQPEIVVEESEEEVNDEPNEQLKSNP